MKYESSQTLGDMTKKVNEVIVELDLPEEIELTFGGDRELFESAIDDMLMALSACCCACLYCDGGTV